MQRRRRVSAPASVVREEDGTIPSTRHPVATTLHEVSRLFTLPQPA